MKKRRIMIAVLLVLFSCFGCTTDQNKEAAEKANAAAEKIKGESSEQEFVYEKTEDGVVLKEYTGNDSYVEIPEEVDGLTVVRINATTFHDSSTIEKIRIPYTVRSIENGLLPEQSSVRIEAYNNTNGYYYAMGQGLALESLGENPAQASYVIIYDQEGKTTEKVELGKFGQKSYTKGIALQEEEGKSVLRMNGNQIGAIVVEESASLTIQLAEDSENVIQGGSGLDGIYSNGNLLITGKGSLQVTGSDVYSVGEGDASFVGCGICTVGNLSIENTGEVVVNSGEAKIDVAMGIAVYNGNIRIHNANVQVYADMNNINSVAVLAYREQMGNNGSITLEDTVISEGGQCVEIQDNTGVIWGTSIGGTGVVTVSEDGKWSNAAAYVRMERSTNTGFTK